MVSVLIYIILALWLVVLLINEKQFEKRGIERGIFFLIFRWKKGLAAIDREAKKRERFFRALGNFAVLLSAPLMVIVFVSLFLNARHILITPDAPPGVAPLLPRGVADIPGVPSVPWEFWLLSVAVILVFHEVMHGLVARAEDIPLKSLGIFAVTFIPLGAFVEPDDEVLEKKTPLSKLRVYAAGSMGNFIAAVLSLLVLASFILLIAPISFESQGLRIYNVTPGSPADKAGITANMSLIGIGEAELWTLEDFQQALPSLQPGVPIIVRTDKGDVEVVPEEREGFKQGFIGLAVLPKLKAKPWLEGLIGEDLGFALYGGVVEAFYWIGLLNFLVGLTNLLPIIPLDGGRMFGLFMGRLIPRGSKQITTFMYVVLLVLVFINAGPLFGLF